MRKTKEMVFVYLFLWSERYLLAQMLQCTTKRASAIYSATVYLSDSISNCNISKRGCSIQNTTSVSLLKTLDTQLLLWQCRLWNVKQRMKFIQSDAKTVLTSGIIIVICVFNNCVQILNCLFYCIETYIWKLKNFSSIR